MDYPVLILNEVVDAQLVISRLPRLEAQAEDFHSGIAYLTTDRYGTEQARFN